MTHSVRVLDLVRQDPNSAGVAKLHDCGAAMSTTALDLAPPQQTEAQDRGDGPCGTGTVSQAPFSADMQALFALMRPGQDYSTAEHASLAAQLRDMAARLDPGKCCPIQSACLDGLLCWRSRSLASRTIVRVTLVAASNRP